MHSKLGNNFPNYHSVQSAEKEQLDLLAIRGIKTQRNIVPLLPYKNFKIGLIPDK